jgi:hypothetical protein
MGMKVCNAVQRISVPVRYFCLLLASFFVKYIGLWTVNFIQ